MFRCVLVLIDACSATLPLVSRWLFNIATPQSVITNGSWEISAACMCTYSISQHLYTLYGMCWRRDSLWKIFLRRQERRLLSQESPAHRDVALWAAVASSDQQSGVLVATCFLIFSFWFMYQDLKINAFCAATLLSRDQWNSLQALTKPAACL